MLIGYARVSTTGQSLDSQLTKLQAEHCERIYKEKVTGTGKKARPELDRLLETAREGDTVVVTKIDRLARSIYDLNGMAQSLREKGVNLRFIDDNLEFKADNDKMNSLHTLTFNIIGAFAQFERDLIVERTGEGRERAKKQGKHMGRPSQPKHEVQRALKLFKDRETNGMTVKDIVEITKVPRATIYREAKKVSDLS